ncbi:MAG: hypothetical protein GY913_15505 [Proteobacteria bacterium]|nr:hypothetical protein [Pseudomonadota bacterium]MCP4918315.1 hypothetical protein [Pseudomonadota bacterium]
MILSTLFALSAAHADPFETGPGPDLEIPGEDGLLDPGAELGGPEPEEDPEIDGAPELPNSVALFAIIDSRRLDEDTRAELGLDSAMVYVYAMPRGELSDGWLVFEGHDRMAWDALDPEAMSMTSQVAIATTETWRRDFLGELMGDSPGMAVVVDAEYASEDLRHASGHPDALYYVVATELAAAESPRFTQNHDYMVAPSAPDAAWDDFRDIAMSPASSSSEVGTAPWVGGDVSQAWRAPVYLGTHWHDAVEWR